MKISKLNVVSGLLAPVAAFWTLSPLKVSATGFALPDQDAFATARGEAFVATADNPSAIYYNPADLDRHFLSVGFGHKGERFDFDVAYQFGYGPDRRVSGSAPSATGQTADGTYNFISHALSVSVSWHF